MPEWSEHYSDGGFRDKLRQGAFSLGRKPLELGLTLYYTLRAPGTPLWCKTVISGSLGYFISLVDAIPDLTPVLGYTDDISVMLAAVAALGAHVTPEIRHQARARTNQLMGESRTPDTPHDSH
ncbi:DUF1232 domain-containing protein [Marinobacter halodurans]|uniref:DUF1232 domain-containing protein n=1 Tax=Marinobacter halodurans TaxID=2528979 RepID=A0ABY1ZLP0_9GAMM|nr:DUF1232 domain-containing protein [Marinobacter halodurans]